jgi:hypothetical protein
MPISTPRTPLSSPFDPSQKPPSNQWWFLAGVHSTRLCKPPIPTRPRYSELPLSPHCLPLAPAHPMIPSTWPNSQRTEPIILGRTSTSPGATPVSSPRRYWMHSNLPFTQTRSPWPAARRPPLPQLREATERRRRPIPVRTSPEIHRRNPSLWALSPLLLFDREI